MKRLLFQLALGAAAIAGISQTSEAGHPARSARVNNYFAQSRPWQGNYAYTPYGEPVALVVPPTANTMAAWSWGVSQSEVRPLSHQFGRAYAPGVNFGSGSPYLSTPMYPSHTDQFGIYPVRGPWR